MKHASVWAWEGLPASIRNRLSSVKQPFFNGLQDPTNHSGSITIIPRSQSQKDADRRDGIKRGGV